MQSLTYGVFFAPSWGWGGGHERSGLTKKLRNVATVFGLSLKKPFLASGAPLGSGAAAAAAGAAAGASAVPLAAAGAAAPAAPAGVAMIGSEGGGVKWSSLDRGIGSGNRFVSVFGNYVEARAMWEGDL